MAYRFLQRDDAGQLQKDLNSLPATSHVVSIYCNGGGRHTAWIFDQPVVEQTEFSADEAIDIRNAKPKIKKGK